MSEKKSNQTLARKVAPIIYKYNEPFAIDELYSRTDHLLSRGDIRKAFDYLTEIGFVYLKGYRYVLVPAMKSGLSLTPTQEELVEYCKKQGENSEL